MFLILVYMTFKCNMVHTIYVLGYSYVKYLYMLYDTYHTIALGDTVSNN